jgi:hypothetical protein
VGDGPALTGHWPTDRPAPAAPAAREEGVVLPIADGAERLGDLTVVLPAGRSLREAERRLLDRLGEQTALAVRNARLSAELAARVAEVDERAGELARSRRRLIDARDAERDRLESAIRTDVTAHLERLPAELDRLADRLAASPARRRLDGLADPAVAALEALRAITRGVYPAQLARFGLETVLTRADARRCRVTVDATVAGRRFPDRVEATTYFCFTELTRGHEEPVDGWLGVRDGALALRVTGATLLAGTLARMRDRVEAVGGSIDCEATATVVRIPVGAAQAAT